MHVLVILFAGVEWIKPTKSRRSGMGTKGSVLGNKGFDTWGARGLLKVNSMGSWRLIKLNHWMQTSPLTSPPPINAIVAWDRLYVKHMCRGLRA